LKANFNQLLNVSYGVNPLIISALWESSPPSRPPVRDKIGSEKDLWSERISKIAKRFLRFARSFLVFGGEAAELQPEFTLLKNLFKNRLLFRQNLHLQTSIKLWLL
jgi:hypothetical protein